MIINRHFFTVFIPLLWAACSLLHFYYPGDEYAMWALSSGAGVWIVFVLDFPGDIHNPALRLSVAIAGAAVMAVFGLLLDMLQASRRLCLTLWGAAFLAVFVYSIHSYPSLDRALAKNGSWQAYILFSINSGLSISVLLTLLFSGVDRLLSKRDQEPFCR